MKIKNLKMNNFRCIHALDIKFHEQTNIFIGINGSGKSGILDCLAVLLSRLIGRLRTTTGTGRFFTEQDITIGKTETVNSIKLILEIRDEIKITEWMMTKSRRGKLRQAISNLEGLRNVVKEFRTELEKDEKINIPLAVYYPVNRAVIEIPLRIRKKHVFEQLAAYDHALSGKRNDFKIFFEWYRNREDLENEKRVQHPVHRDRQLDAVRKAIENFLPSFENLRVQRSPLRMTVQKGSYNLNINQLSDGEKCLLALIGDLARRLAIANPSLKDPLMGKGIVLIDEIDLHLHPSWQRMIVPRLETTFPNCQFVLTTHSAQILSHVRAPESIFLLKYMQGEIHVFHPESAYGLDSNRILEDIMDVPARPEKIKVLIQQMFDMIDRKDLERARLKLSELKERIGTDPELAKADVLIRRMELIGR